MLRSSSTCHLEGEAGTRSEGGVRPGSFSEAPTAHARETAAPAASARHWAVVSWALISRAVSRT